MSGIHERLERGWVAFPSLPPSEDYGVLVLYKNEANTSDWLHTHLSGEDDNMFNKKR